MEINKNIIIGYLSDDFDMFNIGHLNAIKNAKDLCDYLIVGVFTNEVIKKNKNINPVIPFDERIKIVSAVKFVDKVIPQERYDIEGKVEIVKKHGINIVFSVPDCQGIEKRNEAERIFGKVGCKVVYLPHTNETNSKELVKKIRKKGFKIGYTTGVFDMFHIGHLNILERAKAQCDYLIVGVSTDECTKSYKNKTPVISFEERKQIVESIKFVDEVIPQESMNKFEAWSRLKFNVLFHGDDWKGSSMYENIVKKLNEVGCEVVFLPHTDGISSTILRNKINEAQ